MNVVNPGLLRSLVSSTRQPLAVLSRNLRSKATIGHRDEKVVFNEDGSMIVCWHPEPNFPYEHTRPIPTQSVKTDSKLKVQAVEDMKELYHHKPERLQRRDLMRLTWTTKHMWFPQTYWRKQKKGPKERPYL